MAPHPPDASRPPWPASIFAQRQVLIQAVAYFIGGLITLFQKYPTNRKIPGHGPGFAQYNWHSWILTCF